MKMIPCKKKHACVCYNTDITEVSCTVCIVVDLLKVQDVLPFMKIQPNTFTLRCTFHCSQFKINPYPANVENMVSF
jgi:hypothetical protein